MLKVTILILVDGFLQLRGLTKRGIPYKCHNPYFSRWFSAIVNEINKDFSKIRHNPYFSRWFSAMSL